MARKIEFTYEDILRREERRGFTSMVKPVGSLCNMRCKYCYYLDKAALYDYHEPKMDDDLLELYIRRNIEGNASPVLSFAWHGGEPLLAGIDFYKKAVALQKKYAEGREVENSIQTNGLLVNREWCDFFRDNNFLVGISIDGPEDIHDAHRFDTGGQPTFARVMKAIEMMYRSRVEYNTLSTVNVHSEGRGHEVYRFLRQISMFMQFLPVAELVSDGFIQSPDKESAQIAPWSVSARGFGQFMCDIFDDWVVNDVGERYVQLFDATLANYVGVQPSICSLCETCGTGLTVEHATEIAAAADRPVHGIRINAQNVLDLFHELKRIASLVVELVHKGEDGNVAQRTDLKELFGLGLDALGAVDDHNSSVGGHKGTVGILREVLVAGGIEDVDAGAVVGELQHRGGNGNTALLLDVHPVRDGMLGRALALDRAGGLDAAGIEQQLLGKRCFTRVRVGYYRERPAAFYLFSVIRHIPHPYIIGNM